jgi:hypothetical protein
MTTKEILAGLTFRLTQLKKGYNALEKAKECYEVLNDYQNRIDEVESIVIWIKENKND